MNARAHPTLAPEPQARQSRPLVEIQRWVRRLHAQGRISPDIQLRIGERDGDPVGLLKDLSGEHELRRGEFLVFGHSGLRVFDERSFFRRYHDPGGTAGR